MQMNGRNVYNRILPETMTMYVYINFLIKLDQLIIY